MATTKGVLKGCGIGCLVTFLLSVAVIVGCGVKLTGGFNDADRSRKEMEAAYGLPGEYAPAADGRVDPARLEIFLAVREELMARCDDFAAADEQIRRMDAMEDDTPKTEVMKEAFKTFGVMMDYAAEMGDYVHARNTALLERGMGLGEYTYLFVLGYYRFLDHETYRDEGRDVQVHLSGRVRRDLDAMMENQLAAARAAGADPAWIALLEKECGPDLPHEEAAPWADGLPPVLAESFAPYRDDLELFWCDHTAPMELQVVTKKLGGLSYHGD